MICPALSRCNNVFQMRGVPQGRFLGPRLVGRIENKENEEEGEIGVS